MDWWSHIWSKLIVIDPGYSRTLESPLMEPYTYPIPRQKKHPAIKTGRSGSTPLHHWIQSWLLATIVLRIVDVFTARGKGNMYYYVLYFFWGLGNLGVTVVANVQFTVYCTKLLLIFIHHRHRIYGIKIFSGSSPPSLLGNWGIRNATQHDRHDTTRHRHVRQYHQLQLSLMNRT